MLPDFQRAARIGEFWSYPRSRTFAELLIDCEEDRTLRAVLVRMLRDRDRGRFGYTFPVTGVTIVRSPLHGVGQRFTGSRVWARLRATGRIVSPHPTVSLS